MDTICDNYENLLSLQSKDMCTDRRSFLKRVAAGSAGLIYGRMSFNLPGAGDHGFRTCQPRISGLANPVFPFYKYANVYNIGEYIPKDQGGKFIQMELIGSEDDKIIVEAVRKGLIRNIYGDPAGWSKFEKTEVEKSVWLNRFYFLPSFARQYFISGDRSYLVDMMSILTTWLNDNPLLPDSPKATYNWRDMQAAWRSIHLSWCYFLGSEGLTEQERGIILKTLRDHSSVLLSGFATQPLNEFNHQSHGALAMLYLGLLFPELGRSDELITSSIRILTHHLESAFFEDGGNVEQMFGYYPFEAHIFRDAFLLMKENNMEIPLTFQPMLKKMADFIVSVAQPDGTMPPVNDSFEMPVAVIVATLYETIGKEERDSIPSSRYFPETQIAVLRSSSEYEKPWYLLVNPALTVGSHAHAGNLALNLWYNNKPFLIDSGCGNYDNPLLSEWYRTSKAHNTVLIDGKSDEATSGNLLWVPKRTTQNRIDRWETGNGFHYCRMISPASENTNSGVTWTRNIALVKDMFTVVYDCFESKKRHKYELFFHFPPSEVKINHERKSFTVISDDNIALVPADPLVISNMFLSEGIISIKGVATKAPIASFIIEDEGTIHSFITFLPLEWQGNKVKIFKNVSEKGAGIKISDGNGHDTCLLFKSDNADSVRFWGHNTSKSFEVF